MAVWDRVFNRNRKASATTRIVVESVGAGRPVYQPRNYEVMAREGFSGNVYVYRGIMEIAKATAAIPWKLFREGRKLTEETQHPILDLLRNPNPSAGAASFWKQAICFYYMSGNMYIEAVGPVTRNGPPLELWPLRPDRMRVVPNTARGVGSYEYGEIGRSINMPAANILHMKMFNPLDDWYGMSPILVASKIIDQMNAANDWNTALFQNGARPDGVFQTTARLDPDQRETLKADVRKMYTGPKNARKPIILESGLTWQQVGANPTDMDWLTGKAVQAREIAIAIGVAPELLGDSANKTYSNVQEARAALYHETVLPLSHEIRDALNTWLVPKWEDDSLRLDIDVSGIPAMQEDAADKRIYAINGLKAGLLTLNAALKLVGEEEIENGDVRYIPDNMTVVPTEHLVPEDEDEDDILDPLAYLIAAGRIPAQIAPPADPVTSQDILLDDATNYAKALRRIRVARPVAARTRPTRKRAA